MNRLVISLFLALSCCTATAGKNLPISSKQVTEPKFEIRLFDEIVKNNTVGIDPKLVLTVAVLETGHGKGKIYEKTHNLFSIKAESSFPRKYFAGGSYYRSYSSDTESIQDFIRLLSTRNRYQTSYQAALDYNSKLFFKRFGNSGYSEDGQYAEKLARVYKEFP